METDEIIREFLNKGVQLDTKVLEFFNKNPQKIQEFSTKIDGVELPVVIDMDFVNKNLQEDIELRIIKQPSINKKISTEEFIRRINKRYENIKGMFENKVELGNIISINKIRDKVVQFSLMGMVKEKNGNKVLLEDQTGEVSVTLENSEDLLEDDVVGVVCKREDNVIIGKKILFPDIPINREINRTKKEINCLLSDVGLGEDVEEKISKILNHIKETSYKNLFIFIFGVVPINDKVKNFFSDLNKYSKKILITSDINVPDLFRLNLPAMIQIENAKIMLINSEDIKKYFRRWPDSSINDVFLRLLKRRHMDPIIDAKDNRSEDVFLLDSIPDLVICHGLGPEIFNYKGTTVICTGNVMTEPIYWLINLKTREIIKVELP